jgi:hypothetical protein
MGGRSLVLELSNMGITDQNTPLDITISRQAEQTPIKE